VRRLWVVTVTSLAITAGVSWNPREVQPSEPGFAPILWEPSREIWVDEFRLTAGIAFLVLAVAVSTISVVTWLDRRELRRSRSPIHVPALGPYRHVDVDVGAELRDATARLRRALHIDFACLVLALASVVYLVARTRHLEARMEIGERIDQSEVRSVAFPSLRHACSLVSTEDRWDDVNAKLALAHATDERLALGEYHWRPAIRQGGRSRGSCHVTFDVDRSFSLTQYVRSVEFSESVTTD
jgi:hypothetical protein